MPISVTCANFKHFKLSYRQIIPDSAQNNEIWRVEII